MWQTLFAAGAGVATVASPCVLPILPMLLGASVGAADGGSRWRPAAIVLGFVLAFTGAAWVFGSATAVLGLSAGTLRTISIGLLALFGVALAWPAGWRLPGAAALAGGGVLQRLADRAAGWGHGPGLGAALLLGASLGVVWTPCAGPVLAAILALVASQQQPGEAAGLLLAYAVGAGLPMLAIAHGGRRLVQRVRQWSRHAQALRQGFGVLMLLTAWAMHTGWDVTLSARVASRLAGLGSTLEALLPAGGVPVVEAPEVPAAAAGARGTAPAFAGLGPWFNTSPLTIEGLRGRVVLVDFWTFGCVNCINTLPHLQRWHQRYAARGLIIVGVHTPEFAFERDPSAVQAAIRRHGLGYAVAMDNGHATWQAWRNRYWPALYLVDRDGRVVFHHIGEGDYAHVEREIERVLGPASN